MATGSCADCGREIPSVSLELCGTCARRRGVCARCLKPIKTNHRGQLCSECKRKPVLWGAKGRERGKTDPVSK